MYNIKQAAARAGVSVELLRAWERRYGIVAPDRTASGYRQFDDEDVARVRLMRTLVDSGWSPSAAAAAIVSGEVPLTDSPDDQRAADPLSGAAIDAPASAVRERFVAGAGSLDAREIEGALDDAFSRGSFERAATDALFPALRALGDAWASGNVSVAGEHLASAAVHRRLGLALDAAARHGALGLLAAPIVVGLPPGGRHELGALAFAVAASRAGLPINYLGADLPIEDWLRAASGASAAVIGVVTNRDRSNGLEVARRLRAAEPNLLIALGGPAASAPPDDLRATVLPPDLTDGVDTLAALIAQRGGRALP